MRAALLMLVALLAVREVAACTPRSWNDNDPVENKPVWSANGRYGVVLRRYEGIADFTSARAEEYFNAREDVPQLFVIAAMYESRPAGRIGLQEIPLDVDSVGDVLISDTGRYLIAVRTPGGACSRHAIEGDPYVTIYRTDGLLVGSVKVEDVFEPYDLMQLSIGSSTAALRREIGEREVVVLSIPVYDNGNQPRYVERRIDVATGVMLDQKRAIFPRPRVYASPVDEAMGKPEATPDDCATTWDEHNFVRIGSNQLFAAAIHAPLPPFPNIAMKARIRGTVHLQVLVSRSGDVLCTRHSRLPFGLDRAASEGVRRWKFTPFLINGQPAEVAGELLFHFHDVDEETWSELMRNALPGR